MEVTIGDKHANLLTTVTSTEVKKVIVPAPEGGYLE